MSVVAPSHGRLPLPLSRPPAGRPVCLPTSPLLSLVGCPWRLAPPLLLLVSTGRRLWLLPAQVTGRRLWLSAPALPTGRLLWLSFASIRLQLAPAPRVPFTAHPWWLPRLALPSIAHPLRLPRLTLPSIVHPWWVRRLRLRLAGQLWQLAQPPSLPPPSMLAGHPVSQHLEVLWYPAAPRYLPSCRSRDAFCRRQRAPPRRAPLPWMHTRRLPARSFGRAVLRCDPPTPLPPLLAHLPPRHLRRPGPVPWHARRRSLGRLPPPRQAGA